MAGCQATIQGENEVSRKGSCPMMALSPTLFISTWQMLLNNSDELPLVRKGKGGLSICVWHKRVNTQDWYKNRLCRDVL